MTTAAPENPVPAALEQVSQALMAGDHETATTAVEAVLRHDRERGLKLLAELLDGADPARLAVAVRAVLDHGDDEGTGPFVSLALSSTLSERRLALDLLAAASPHVAWPLLLRMFEQETEPAMMEREADLLERVLPEKGVEKLYDLRLGLDLALEDVEGGPGVEIVEQRMDLVARILSKMFVTYRLTEPEVDALEQSFEHRVGDVLGSHRSASPRGSPRSERLGRVQRPPNERTRLGLAALMGFLIAAGVAALAALLVGLR
jgi:hypothetical protein